jgi:cytochrome c-type biogenesis protein CcmH/NrfG
VTEERARLTERRDIIRRDIEELAEQVEAGEIGESTADDLRARYDQDLAEVEAQLAKLPKEQPKVYAGDAQVIHTDSAPDAHGWDPKRVLIGGGVLVAAFTVVLVLAVSAAQNSSQDTTTTTGANAATIQQMEAAVAANPDVVEMRIALADLYLQDNQVSNALNEYLDVLDLSPTDADASYVLGRVGWLAYQQGQNDAAASYLDQALQRDPTNIEATLFMGIVDLYGLNDPASAVPLLQQVLAQPDLPEDMRSQIQAALDDAQALLGS